MRGARARSHWRRTGGNRPFAKKKKRRVKGNVFRKSTKGGLLVYGGRAGESSGACARFDGAALLVTFIGAVINTPEPL